MGNHFFGPMRHFPNSPKELVGSAWRNRSLIRALAQREVLSRYRGSALGLLWSVINPLLMLSVYTFVFSTVFKARWGSGHESKTEFALVLFAGLLVFNMFAECVNRAPSLVLGNANYVKKVVFPLETLGFVLILSSLFHMIVGLSVWMAVYTLLVGLPPPTSLALPLVLAPLALLSIGLTWTIASLGVFFRDISQFTNLITTILLFLSPVFYPASALPEPYRNLLILNPLSPAIEMTRDVIYWGRLPAIGVYAPYAAATSLIAWIGFVWFQKTRKGFADVI